MDPLVGGDVLAQRSDGVVPEDGGVEGIAAQLGMGGCVGRLAVIGHRQLLDRNGIHRLDVGRRGVHHHRCVDPLKRPGVDHGDLAATALLGGRAEDHQVAVEFVDHRCCGQAGTQAGGGDDVVAAGVTDTGQGVVLADHRHRGARSPAGAGLEHGVQPVGAPGDRQVGLLEDIAEQVVGSMFGVGQFGIGMDAM